MAFPDATPTTQIQNANLICQSSGAKIAVDTDNKRLWQSDVGLDEGLEVKVLEFLPHRVNAKVVIVS